MKTDYEMARSILTKAQFVVYKAKCKTLLNSFYGCMKSAQNSKRFDNGFWREAYARENEVAESHKKLMDFFHSNKLPNEYKKVVNDGFLNKIKRKFRQAKISVFNKAVKDTSVIGKLNSYGIMVEITTGSRS